MSSIDFNIKSKQNYSNYISPIKWDLFQAVVVSILLYGCTTWTQTKWTEKLLDGNYTRMLQTILNKSWKQHPMKQQLYSHLPPISKTIQVRQTRCIGHCWRNKDELTSDFLPWTPTHGHVSVNRQARTYLHQLYTGCSLEDLLGAMDDTIYPTPPLGQDMTQGQFFRGV